MGKHTAEHTNMSNTLVETVAKTVLWTSNACEGFSTHGAQCFRKIGHTGPHRGFKQFTGNPHTWGRYRQA